MGSFAVKKWVLSALPLFCAAASAQASPTVWGFDGVSAGSAYIGGPCAAAGCQDIWENTPFTLKVTFGASPWEADSANAVRLDIGNYFYESSFAQAYVSTNPFSPGYSVNAGQPGPFFNRLMLTNCFAPFSTLPTLPALGDAPCNGPSYLSTVAGAGIALQLTRAYDISSVAAPVPEPSTYALWLAGLGAVVLWNTRRNKVQRHKATASAA